MNLHQIAAGAIGAINPFITITINRNTGYTTARDGSRIANFITLSGPAQLQDLSSDDLRLVDGLNIQGNHRVVFLNGSWAGVVRSDRVGGDVFFFEGKRWLVAKVAEAWPDWCKCIVTQQNG